MESFNIFQLLFEWFFKQKTKKKNENTTNRIRFELQSPKGNNVGPKKKVTSEAASVRKQRSQLKKNETVACNCLLGEFTCDYCANRKYEV